MAVVDKYTDANQQAGNRAKAATSLAATISAGVAGVVVASGDDDGSKYRVFRDVPVSMTIARLDALVTTGITGSTSWAAGVYKTAQDGGAVIDVDLFSTGTTMASAGRLNLLTGVADANANLSIADLYFAVNAANIGVSEVDIVLTAATVGTADGSFRVVSEGVHD